jgi:dihydroxyacetone kinase phosphotransfer subunit
MADKVGILVVSHSPKVAEGTVDMVRQMVGEDVVCVGVGGNASGGLGMDAATVLKGIERVWSNAGVAILVDLGGAEMNSDMAIELLDEARRPLVRICAAPIVEGAVIAATEASSGSSLDEVVAAAEAMG